MAQAQALMEVVVSKATVRMAEAANDLGPSSAAPWAPSPFRLSYLRAVLDSAFLPFNLGHSPIEQRRASRAGIWLIVKKWLLAEFGRYLAGGLRSNRFGPRTDEVAVRHTAQRFLLWALATSFLGPYSPAAGRRQALQPGPQLLRLPSSQSRRVSPRPTARSSPRFRFSAAP